MIANGNFLRKYKFVIQHVACVAAARACDTVAHPAGLHGEAAGAAGDYEQGVWPAYVNDLNFLGETPTVEGYLIPCQRARTCVCMVSFYTAAVCIIATACTRAAAVLWIFCN